MSGEEFSVSIVTCDSYQFHPVRGYDETYCQLRGRAVSQVPVIRIFGVTPSGQKTCVHVHGTYPYVSVEYEGDLEKAKEYSQQLASNLEKMLNKEAKTVKQHVHCISPFQAVPFYGFHEGKQNFLKIQFYSTSSLKRSVDLLNSGSILNQSFQPYEAHIPYILQFFIDHNLFGMNMLRLRRVAFRLSETENVLSVPSETSVGPKRFWKPGNLPSEKIAKIARQSVCELEVDCIASDILNSLDINVAVNPGLAAIWEEERQRHKEQFNESEITPAASQDRSQVEMMASEKKLLLSWKEKLFNMRHENSRNEDHHIDSDDEIDYSFVEAMANLKALEEADCILNTQHSSSSLFLADSDDEEKETLEMSQVIDLTALEDSFSNREKALKKRFEKVFGKVFQPDTSLLVPSNSSSAKVLSSRCAAAITQQKVEVVAVSDNSESNDMSQVFAYSDLVELTSSGSEARIIDDKTTVEVLSSSGSNIPPSGRMSLQQSEPHESSEDFLIQLDGAHGSDERETPAVPVKPVLRLRNKSRSSHVSKTRPDRTRRLSLRTSKSAKVCDDDKLDSLLMEPGCSSNHQEKLDVKQSSVPRATNLTIHSEKKRGKSEPNTCKSEPNICASPSSESQQSKRILRKRTSKLPAEVKNTRSKPRQRNERFRSHHYSSSELFRQLPSKTARLLLDNKITLSTDLNLKNLIPIGNENITLKREISVRKSDVGTNIESGAQNIEQNSETPNSTIVVEKTGSYSKCEPTNSRIVNSKPFEYVHASMENELLPPIKRLPNTLGNCVHRSGDRDVLFNLAFLSSDSSNPSSQNSLPRCTSPSEMFIVESSGIAESDEIVVHLTSEAMHKSRDISASKTHKIVSQENSTPDFLKESLLSNKLSDFCESESNGNLHLSVSSEDFNSQKSAIGKLQSSDSLLFSPRSNHSEDSRLFLTIDKRKLSLDTDSSIPLSQASNTMRASPMPSRDWNTSRSPQSTSTLAPNNRSPHVTSFYNCLLNFSSESSDNTLEALHTSAINSSFNDISKPTSVCTFNQRPPPRPSVENSLKKGYLFQNNKKLHYRTKLSELEEFKSVIYTDATWRNLSNKTAGISSENIWTPVILPPSRRIVQEWCDKTVPKSNRQKDSPQKSARENIQLESTLHNLSVDSISAEKLQKGKSLHSSKRLFLSRNERNLPSPIPTDLERSPTSDTSTSKDASCRQVLTPRRFEESFSMIEGHCPSGEMVVPSVREKFHSSSNTNAVPLSLLSLELHVRTRGDLKPDPKEDPILGIFFCLQRVASDPALPAREAGAFLVAPQDHERYVDSGSGFGYLGVGFIHVATVENEKQLLEEFVQLMHRWDPDIVIGYEIQRQSWGYLLERWSPLEPALCSSLSRIPQAPKGHGSRAGFDADDPGTDVMSEIVLSGRIVLDVWKILRGEFALNSYTFENVFHHILNKRIPKFSYKVLTEFYNAGRKQRKILLEYYLQRSIGSVELFEHFNLVGRTSELARIIGIQFFEVFSRGSQFRVESIMLRIVRSRGFLPVSCSVMQRAHARAPECVQLIMEPDSRLYADPVLVLDFQSLYPSIIIAYNYCYSTCLGRLEHLGKKGPFEFGCTTLTVPQSLLETIENDVTISPNGVVFVKPSVRKGIIPVMLEEILNTRFMVKKSMKENKGNKAVEKLLDARQLAMKLIANVTYGYTGANFSGRMPCVEVADSILSKSRETLETAIRLVESKWDATVVYGDTDSMFVWLPGRSKSEAFRIGQEMVDAVSASNPSPIKLKFEKVYLPCILQTKKRYVGYMYETLDQKEPVFDAKGIETVRRDSCPAVPKVLEKSLRILFDSLDLQAVESYVKRQFQKVLCNRASMQDLIFAKEFRGMTGYRPTACVPALEIAKRLTQVDPRAEPLSGERVPYVVVYGPPGLPLIRLVKQPQEVLADPALKLNAIYYVTKVLAPPLDRMFALIGVNVHKWIQELPRVCVEGDTVDDSPSSSAGAHPAPAKASLSQYFSRVGCLVCGAPSDGGLCPSCVADPQTSLVVLGEKQAQALRKQHHLLQICQSCSGMCASDVPCSTLDCPVNFQVIRCRGEVKRATHSRKQALKLLHLTW